jgi:hypothetical protein
MKQVVIAVLATSLFLSPSAFAEANGKSVKSAKVPAIKCATTKAVGHNPAFHEHLLLQQIAETSL